MGPVQRRAGEWAETLIGVMWAIGMATGIMLADLWPGYEADLLSFLFGSILAVPSSALPMMVGLDVVIIGALILFYKDLQAISLDEAFATVENVSVNAIYLVLMGLVALTVVMLMRVVGLILVIALLTIPAAMSGRFVKSMESGMGLASFLGMLLMTAGLWVSYFLRLTSGVTITLLAGAAHLLSLAVRRLIDCSRTTTRLAQG